MTRCRNRAGFTVLETIMALGVLSVAAVVVAQTATWSLFERARTEERLAATEAAANVLEAGRARPWAELTPEWAAAEQLPEDVAARLSDPSLAVRVAEEPGRPRVKRVTIELKWTDRYGKDAPPIVLVGLFADRSAGGDR
jgi:type II secretory pathway pseudopilin PulG